MPANLAELGIQEMQGLLTTATYNVKRLGNPLHDISAESLPLVLMYGAVAPDTERYTRNNLTLKIEIPVVVDIYLQPATSNHEQELRDTASAIAGILLSHRYTNFVAVELSTFAIVPSDDDLLAACTMTFRVSALCKATSLYTRTY